MEQGQPQEKYSAAAPGPDLLHGEERHGNQRAQHAAQEAGEDSDLKHGLGAVAAGIHRHGYHGGGQRSNQGGHGGQSAEDHG